ncbi:MAG: hypothetical protein IJR57_08285 [Ruminococcus sp.]|nr:hypothetical protein [Ruminococcus sp.]
MAEPKEVRFVSAKATHQSPAVTAPLTQGSHLFYENYSRQKLTGRFIPMMRLCLTFLYG